MSSSRWRGRDRLTGRKRKGGRLLGNRPGTWQAKRLRKVVFFRSFVFTLVCLALASRVDAVGQSLIDALLGCGRERDTLVRGSQGVRFASRRRFAGLILGWTLLVVQPTTNYIRCATLPLPWRPAGGAVHKGMERVASCEVASCE